MALQEITAPRHRGIRRGLRLPSAAASSRMIVMGIRIASMVVNFLVQIVMARIMGLAAFGSANTALAILNIIVIPAAFGYDTAAIRFVALDRDDPAHLRALTMCIGRTVALGSLLTALAVGVAAAAEKTLGSAELAVGLAFLVVIVPPFAFIRVGEAWLRGFGSVVRAQLSSNIAVPLLTIVFLLLARWGVDGGRSVGTAGALGARAVATAIAMAVVGMFIFRRLGGALRPRDQVVAAKRAEMQQVALVLCGVAFLTMAVSQVDVVAVSYIRGASAAGIYSAASRVAQAMNVCIVAVAFVLAPQVARLFAERKMSELQDEVSTAAFWSGALMLCACAILIPASGLVLEVFGAKFSSGSNALRILMLGQLANGSCGPVAIVLNMTGRQTLAIRALGLAAVADLALLATLVPWLGLNGAACATAVCTLIWNVGMLAYVRRELGIWVLPRFLARALP